MLVARFIIGSEAGDPYAHVRTVRRGRVSEIYSGLLSGWKDAAKDVKATRKCVVCLYEGEAVMTVRRSGKDDIASDIESNARMFSESCSFDSDELCFADRQSLKGIRRFLQEAGAFILTEHLIPDGRLADDKALMEYYNGLREAEFSLKAGTLDEGRMLRYRLSQLREAVLPALCTFAVLSIAGAVVRVRTEPERQSLAAEVAAYKRMSGKLHPIVDAGPDSALDAVLPERASYVATSLAACRPDGLLFRGVGMNGRAVTVDGMAQSSEVISCFTRNLAEAGLCVTSEVSAVRRSDVPGMMDFTLRLELEGGV